MNYQLEKKRSDNLNKAQKKPTVLEGELRKKEKEFAATVEEPNKKKGEIVGFKHVAQGSICQRLRSWLEQC